jgi:chemotaxis signal transduction protein
MASYCVFNVGNCRVGIEMTSVREIIDLPLITPTRLPLTPAFIHGLFNLRGQVLPYLDLGPMVGAKPDPIPANKTDRAVIVEKGAFRFATLGRRIDTLEAEPSSFAPPENAALYPALEAEAQSVRGPFQIIHLERLEACLAQQLKLADHAEPAVP